MKYFQNKVSESSFTLPIVAILVVLASVAVVIFSHGDWMSLPLMAFSTVAMLEMNNRNLLLRIRSRMVSTTFLLLTMMCGWVNADWHIAFIQMCFVGFSFLALLTTQDRSSAGRIFYAFLFLSAGSMIWQGLLWLLPFLLFLFVVPLYAFSSKTISAFIMALLLPYLLYALYLIYNNIGDYEMLADNVLPKLSTDVFLDYTCVTIGVTLNYTVLVLLTILGTIHFIHKAYMDKIRTRICYHFFISFAWIIIVFAAVAPVYAQYLLPILCVPLAPLLAHYLALTSSKLTNISFFVIISIILLVTIFNQCLTSLSNMVLGV